MKRLSICIIIVTAALFTACSTHHFAYHYTQVDDSKRKQSVPLWLPQTVLEFRATCERTTQSASPLYIEAIQKIPRFTLDELECAAACIDVNIGSNSLVTVSFVDPTLGVRGERDPNQLYYVYLNDSLMTAVDFESDYAPDGVIGSVSSTRNNKTTELVIKTLEIAAGIAGKVVGLGAKVNPSSIMTVGKANIPLSFAERIKKIRDYRDELHFNPSARAGLDGAALGRLLDDLAKEEAELTEQFTGSRKTLTSTLSATIRPRRGEIKSDIPLLAFDSSGKVFQNASDMDIVTLGPVVPQFAATLNSWKLSFGDFIKLQSLATNIVSSDRQFDIWLRTHLPSNAQGALEKCRIGEPLNENEETAILNGFNSILERASIYEQSIFSGITLRETTMILLAQKPEGRDVQRLNRMLLEDAFPKLIASGTTIVLELTPREGESSILADLHSFPLGKEEGGIPYQVPAQCFASIVSKGVDGASTDLLSTGVLIGQWGVIGRLPASMGTPASSVKPTYYTDTGALKKLIVGSTPPVAGTLAPVGDAASSVLDGVKARRESDSELERLRKQKEMLELEVAIKNAQTTLGRTNAPAGDEP